MKTLKFDLAFEVAWSASCDVFLGLMESEPRTMDYGMKNRSCLAEAYQ